MVIADAIAIGVCIIVAHTVTVGIHVVAIAKAAALIVADTVTIGIHIANTCAVASTIACAAAIAGRKHGRWNRCDDQ